MPAPTYPTHTLFEAVLRLARELLLVRQGVATSGNTVTLTDTASNFPEDTWIGGTIFIPTDYVFRVISSHVGNAFSFASIGTNVIAGNPYEVANADLPLDVLVSAINSAIQAMTILEQDISLTVENQQDTYTLPDAAANLLAVEIAQNAIAPFGFVQHQHWDVMEGTLHFPANFNPGQVGNSIRLTYRKPFTPLTSEIDAIPNGVDLDCLHWLAVEDAAKYGLKIHGADPKRDWTGKVNEAEVRVQRYMGFQPKTQRVPRLADW